MEALPLLHRAAPGAKVVLLTALEPVDVPDAILSQALGIFDKATDLSCLVDRLSTLVTPT